MTVLVTVILFIFPITVRSNNLVVNCFQTEGYCEIQNLTVNEKNQNVTELKIIESDSQKQNLFSVILKCETDNHKTNRVKYLPIGLFSEFERLAENVTNFLFDGCKDLKELTGNEFKDGENLQRLTISNTSLSKINEKSFEKLSNLIALDLSSNQLEKLSDGVFRGLKNLSGLDLSSNKIQCLQEGLFESNLNLREIHATDNELVYIGPEQFRTIRIIFAFFKGNKCEIENHLIPFSTFSKLLYSTNCTDERKCSDSKTCLNNEQILSIKNNFLMLSYIFIFSGFSMILLMFITLKLIVLSKGKSEVDLKVVTQNVNEQCHEYEEVVNTQIQSNVD